MKIDIPNGVVFVEPGAQRDYSWAPEPALCFPHAVQAVFAGKRIRCELRREDDSYGDCPVCEREAS